jgi:plasmid stability protein
MQYTIRNIPAALDKLLRRRARERGASLNETAVEALAHGLGADLAPVKRRDLSDIAGAWKSDPLFDEAVRHQDSIDPELWR